MRRTWIVQAAIFKGVLMGLGATPLFADPSILEPAVNTASNVSLRVSVRLDRLEDIEELDLLSLVLRGQPLRLTSQCRIYRNAFIDQVQTYQTSSGQSIDLIELSRYIQQDSSRFWRIREQDNYSANRSRALRNVFPGQTRRERLQALRQNFINSLYSFNLNWSQLDIEDDQRYFVRCRATLEVTSGIVVLVHPSSFVTSWRNSSQFQGKE